MKLYLMVTIILIGCKNEIDVKNKEKGLMSESEQKASIFQDTPTFKDVMTLTKSEAVLKYGRPISQEQFVLDDLQGEFRIGLYNIYSKEERLSESILIDEVTWEKDKKTWVTVWYQITVDKAVPKDALTWGKGTDF